MNKDVALSNRTPARPRAIALLSGGLDSMLAAKMVADFGIEVVGLYLSSPFGCREQDEKTAGALGIPLIVRDKGEAYLELVKDPKFGYGRAINPCIDCRIYMFEIADKVREETNADFIVTGEVIGQRPMSQQRKAMEIIDEQSEVIDDRGGRVLRPLSAKLLDPTLAEREGWVDREKMLGLSGRKRQTQLEMAETYGLTEFGTPSGGCLLTEYSFVPKLKDFFANAQFKSTDERMTQAELLRIGRHFRLSPTLKVILARNKEENEALEARWKNAGGAIYYPDGFSGPHCLALGPVDSATQEQIGRMIRRYSRPQPGANMVSYQSQSDQGQFEALGAITDEELEALRV